MYPWTLDCPRRLLGSSFRLLKGDWYTRALKVTLVARGYFAISGNSMTTTVVPLLKQVFKQPTGSFPVRWDYQLVIFPMSRSSP